MKLLGKTVLIKPHEVKITKVIETDIKSETLFAEVIQISDEVENPEVKAGDIIVIRSESGEKVEIKNKPHYVISYEDILARYD